MGIVRDAIAKIDEQILKLRAKGEHEIADEIEGAMRILKEKIWYRWRVSEDIFDRYGLSTLRLIKYILYGKSTGHTYNITLATAIVLAENHNGMDVKELAKILKLPPSHVRHRLSRTAIRIDDEGRVWLDEDKYKLIKQIVKTARKGGSDG